MKLLCVGNGCFTKRSSRLLTHQHTGMFLFELARRCDGILFMQMVSKAADQGTVNDYVLGSDKVDAVAVRIADAGKLRKLLSYARAIPSIFRQVRNADYVYLFAPGVLSLLAASCASVSKTSYGVYLRGERWLDTRWMQWVLSRADFVCANGGVLVERVRALCDDVELTVPMIDLTPQDCVGDRMFNREPPWSILYVGRIEGRKGVNELVEAARILKQRGLEFQLNLVGDGTALTTIKALSAECVNCLGLISDRQKLFSLYKTSDLFVFPSHDEGFPRVLYEAMAFQAPIVTTFVGSVCSLMADGVNCLKVAVGSPVELASTIERALKDVDLRQRIARNGSETIRQLLESNAGNSHAQQVWGRVVKYAKTR